MKYCPYHQFDQHAAAVVAACAAALSVDRQYSRPTTLVVAVLPQAQHASSAIYGVELLHW